MIIAAALLVLAAPAVRAQEARPVGRDELPMLHFTAEDGLPSNIAYQVYRDRRGFLWVATNKGVSRYNGIRFENFTTFDGLPDNEIFLFREDDYGRLWLGTYNGRLCYYKDGVFHTSDNTPFLKKIPFISTFVRQINVEKDSSIIFRFSVVTKFLVIHNEDFRIFDVGNLKVNCSLENIVSKKKINDNNYQLIFTDKTIDFDTLYNVLSLKPLPDSISNLNMRFSSDQNQNYFYNESFVFDENFHRVAPLPPFFNENHHIYIIYRDSNNTFITSADGVFINMTTHLFKGKGVTAVTQDVNGNYWISTIDNGIYAISGDALSGKQPCRHYEGKAKYAAALGGRLCVVTDDNRLYRMTKDTVRCLFDFQKYSVPGRLHSGYSVTMIDKTGRFLAFCDSAIYELNNVLSDNHQRMVAIRTNSSEITKSAIVLDNHIYALKIISISKSADSVGAMVSTGKATFNMLVDNRERIFCIAKSPENALWYSTIDGMYKIEHNKGVRQAQFGGNSFKTFDFFGKFMLGATYDNKLIISGDYETRAHLFTVNGQDCIWDKFYTLDSTHILAATNNLYRLLTLHPGDTVAPVTVTAIDDPYLPLAAETICCDSANCYFFKNGAITAIAGAELLKVAAPPRLFFKTLKTNRRSCLIDNEVHISFAEARNITISFSALSFGGKDVTYQYSLSKNDEDNWRDLRGNELNLINSGFGAFTIKLRARTISSGFCAPISFSLVIGRPYWASWWFILLVTAVAGACILALFRMRITYLLHIREKRHENEKKLMKMEYKALNALMNPHFIFNTLNNVQGLINKNERAAANKYLGIFAALIRQNMLNISRELISLQKEMEIVTNYLELEKLRFKDLLNYEIIADPAIDLSEIMIPPLLVQPLVENSIKHGILPRKSRDSLIRVEISEHGDTLVISVKDNGIGMEASRQNTDPLHQSYGLDNIRKRIAQLEMMQNKRISLNISEINDDAGRGPWTVVSITISL